MDNTLNILNHQLAILKRLIENDEKKGFFIYNYLIHTVDIKFLDVDGLKNYITTTDVKNNIVLKEILILCDFIIEFYNIKSLNLIEKNLEVPINVIKENNKGYFYSQNDIYAIMFDSNNKLFQFNYLNEKEFFIKKYNYQQKNLKQLALICRAIISWITAAYNELGEFYIKNSKSLEIEEQTKEIIKNKFQKQNKITDKWRALLYLIEVEVYNKKIPINREGEFIKSEIEKIGKVRGSKTGQMFYKQVRSLKDNINSNKDIKRIFIEEWKKK